MRKVLLETTLTNSLIQTLTEELAQGSLPSKYGSFNPGSVNADLTNILEHHQFNNSNFKTDKLYKG